MQLPTNLAPGRHGGGRGFRRQIRSGAFAEGSRSYRRARTRTWGGESNGHGRTGTAKHNQWLDLSSSDLCSGASRIIDIFAEVKFETSFVFPVMICFGSRLAMVSFGRCRGGWLILCLLISQCCNYVLHPLAANKWTLMLQLQGCLAL